MIELEAQKELGRAKNAVQGYLIRKLLYPKVYLDAEWDGAHADLLAIDRTGVGDVHVVRIISVHPHFTPPTHGHELTMASSTKELSRYIEEMRSLSGHFRYLASVEPGSKSREYYPASNFQQAALAKDGVGRIGFLLVDLSGDEPAVKVLIKPERFRSSKQITDLADRYVTENQANWEVRE